MTQKVSNIVFSLPAPGSLGCVSVADKNFKKMLGRFAAYKFPEIKTVTDVSIFEKETGKYYCKVFFEEIRLPVCGECKGEGVEYNAFTDRQVPCRDCHGNKVVTWDIYQGQQCRRPSIYIAEEVVRLTKQVYSLEAQLKAQVDLNKKRLNEELVVNHL